MGPTYFVQNFLVLRVVACGKWLGRRCFPTSLDDKTGSHFVSSCHDRHTNCVRRCRRWTQIVERPIKIPSYFPICVHRRNLRTNLFLNFFWLSTLRSRPSPRRICGSILPTTPAGTISTTIFGHLARPKSALDRAFLGYTRRSCVGSTD